MRTGNWGHGKPQAVPTVCSYTVVKFFVQILPCFVSPLLHRRPGQVYREIINKKVNTQNFQPAAATDSGLHRLKRILRGFHILSCIHQPKISLSNLPLSPSENPPTSTNSLLTRVSVSTGLPPPQAPDHAIDPDIRLVSHSPPHQLVHQLLH